MTTREEQKPRERSWPAHTPSPFGDGSCRRCRLELSLWATQSCRVIAHQPVGACWLCHPDGGGTCGVAGLKSSLRFITPIEARILCEEQIAVVLEVLSEPPQQALLYRILRRLDWTEASADRVLKAEGWDDPSAG